MKRCDYLAAKIKRCCLAIMTNDESCRISKILLVAHCTSGWANLLSKALLQGVMPEFCASGLCVAHLFHLNSCPQLLVALLLLGVISLAGKEIKKMWW